MTAAAVLLCLGFSAPVQAGIFFQDNPDSSCKQKPDSTPPLGQHWYYHVGDNGQPCWHLRPWAKTAPVRSAVRPIVARHKFEANPAAASEQAPPPQAPADQAPADQTAPDQAASHQAASQQSASSDQQLPPQIGEWPNWTFQYNSDSKGSAPTTGQGSQTAPNFLERWNGDANRVAARSSNNRPPADAAPTIHPDVAKRAEVQFAASPHKAGWGMISFAALLLSAALAAALAFGLAQSLRQRKILQTLFGGDVPEDGLYAPPLEVKLVPDLVKEENFYGASIKGRASADELSAPMALFVPAKYRDQSKGKIRQAATPGIDELDADLTDLLRRLRRFGVAH